ncbi:MAG: UDP-N-acetylglucosamine 1-carboxyvinyltransferase [Rhodobacteraceae bacterium]|nr:UDP-N-acetylglucosamine 1-carboxyvinyltransferase [Paracoccaceae bacterium]
MDSIKIRGPGPLKGCISIAGAKNACLALMPAALLTDQPLTLTNTPRLSDITTMTRLLQSVGVEVRSSQEGRVLTMRARQLINRQADYNIVRKMRASILVLGPLLARTGRAAVSLPGGCAIGARPVNLHLQALTRLGAEIQLDNGYIEATANSGLRGAIIEFPSVSVGATENVLMAACLAAGTTEIRNAAREPEIIDLANCLDSMGARIHGAGTHTITVEGVPTLAGGTHSVIPDRIELGTYMLAGAIAGGELMLEGGRLDLVGKFVEKLAEAGVGVSEAEGRIHVQRNSDRLLPVNVVTEPYPGFPTDLQAQMMAAMTLADGVSRIEENVFENRFMHAPELMRMGARIEVSGGKAKVTGVDTLRGAPVMATDLRASVSLILAGLAAEGTTTVNRIYHLDRGYEQIEDKLSACGADIRRIA